MRNNLFQEIVLSSVLLILLILFLNPFDLWMPGKVLMLMVFILVVVFTVFAVFIWREHARDEREMLHSMFAGRIAFLAGSAILTGGIIYQGLKHEVDIWLVIAVGAMILGKITGLVYSRLKN